MGGDPPGRPSRTHVRTMRYHEGIPDPRAVEHGYTSCSRRTRVAQATMAAPEGWSSGRTMAGRGAGEGRRAAARKEPHVTTRTSPTAMVGRRAHAQRRLRRAASRRLFRSTNGCTTYLILEADGRRASCPICGLRRSLEPGFVIPSIPAGHRVPVAPAT